MVDPIIKERIEALTPDYKGFVLSDFAEVTAAAFGKTLGLDEDKALVMENGIAMFILFFFNKPELIQYLQTDCGLDEYTATSIVSIMLSDLPPKVVEGMEMAFNNFNPGHDDTPITTSADSTPGIPSKPTIPQAGARDLTFEQQKAVATGKEVKLRDIKQATQQQVAEHVAKGIRTMRDDVERLRHNGNEPVAIPSKMSKPFGGQ